MESIRWTGEQLELLDQRRLPTEEVWLTLHTAADVAAAITDMVVRGAPAIACLGRHGGSGKARLSERAGSGAGRLRRLFSASRARGSVTPDPLSLNHA